MIGKVEIKGGKELAEKLKQLDEKIAVRGIVRALQAAGEVIKEDAEATMPERTGTLRSNVKLKMGHSREGRKSVVIGFNKKWYTGDTFYAAFLEFGHKLGKRKFGNKRFQIPGEHPLEYAFDESKEKALDVLIETLRVLVDKAAKGGE